MSTDYVIKKCKSFGFAKTIEDCISNIFLHYHSDNKVYYITDKVDINITDKVDINITDKVDINITDKVDIGNNIEIINSIDKLTNDSNNETTIIIVDLESSLFDDIHIIQKNKDEKKEDGLTNTEYTVSKEDMKKQLAGDSSHLDAFTTNAFAVILGKKSANIFSSNYRQNHDVLDSLARNGVVCSPITDKVLSIQKLIDKLTSYKSFKVFAIHSALDLKFIEHEFPSEISHPSYIIGKGEITAVFYRYLLLNFFGYCSIITDSMRENNYLF